MFGATNASSTFLRLEKAIRAGALRGGDDTPDVFPQTLLDKKRCSRVDWMLARRPPQQLRTRNEEERVER